MVQTKHVLPTCIGTHQIMQFGTKSHQSHAKFDDRWPRDVVGRREAAGENFGLRTSAGADPSSLSQLSQDKDHLRELLTFAVLTHFRKIRPGSGSTFANYGPGIIMLPTCTLHVLS